MYDSQLRIEELSKKDRLSLKLTEYAELQLLRSKRYYKASELYNRFINNQKVKLLWRLN